MQQELYGKKLSHALDFLKFCGSKEGESAGTVRCGDSGRRGAAGYLDYAFDKFDYKMNVEKCTEMFAYGVQSVNNASRPNWKTQVNDTLLKIYSGSLTLDEGLARMQQLVDEAAEP